MTNRMAKLQQNISIKNWIFYDEDVGVLALHQWGQPGSGKSNMSTGLAAQCVSKNNEFLIMPGDRWCEWKHFLSHPLLDSIKITVLIPDDLDPFFYGLTGNEDFFKKVNYKELNPLDYLTEEKRILVIYDAHIHPKDRTFLWLSILKQLLNRREHINRCFGILYHEASVLFPERARDNKWHDIQEYSQLFVECRKALIRHQFVSQTETEIESSFRTKCTYQILRRGRASRHHHMEVRKSTPFLEIDEYNLVIASGGFKKYNDTKKFYENKKIMKIIPSEVTYVERGVPSEQDKMDFKPDFSEKYGKIFYTPRDSSGKFLTNKSLETTN